MEKIHTKSTNVNEIIMVNIYAGELNWTHPFFGSGKMFSIQKGIFECVDVPLRDTCIATLYCTEIESIRMLWNGNRDRDSFTLVLTVKWITGASVCLTELDLLLLLFRWFLLVRNEETKIHLPVNRTHFSTLLSCVWTSMRWKCWFSSNFLKFVYFIQTFQINGKLCFNIKFS